MKMAKRYKIGWFSTGRGEGSRAMLQAAHHAIITGQLNAEIEFVYCAREQGETDKTDAYLNMVKEFGIPLVSYSYQRYRAEVNMPSPDLSQALPQWRLDYDAEVLKRLEKYHPNLVILAGLMIVTSPLMCDKYEIINLHPAAPGGPAGTWQQVIWKLIETKAQTQGIKMHVAIPKLDMGPTATFCTFAIRGGVFDPLWKEIEGRTVEDIKAKEGVENALFKKIREYGAAREVPLILATLKSFSEGRIKITKDRQVVNAAGQLCTGYDLTGDIDEMVQGKLA
jgi:phosphoribosylglycinamide formyltransferase 1